MKHLITVLLILSFYGASAQNTGAKNALHVKTRYTIKTIYDPTGGKHVDTTHFQTFTRLGKSPVYNEYKDNRVSSSIMSTINAHDQVTSMTFKTRDLITSREDYFYDTQGNTIKTITHRFYKLQTGEIKEFTPDTISQAFDKKGNRISLDSRTAHHTWKYDKNNNLVETGSSQPQKSKTQKEVKVYRDGLLMETQSYWFDGKLYHRISNEYNSRRQLTSIRDSTTNWFQSTHSTYNRAGLKATDTIGKTFMNKQTQTVATFTYDEKGMLSTATYHSNDHLLLPLYPFSTRLKNADYDLKETYTYDKYGNRLRITTELNGTIVKVIDFLMTYYE
jgi:hypothetical protein